MFLGMLQLIHLSHSPGFLNPGIVDVLVWVILCHGGYPVDYKAASLASTH